MPFKNEAQRRLMWAKHPSIAKRWTEKYGATPQSEKPKPKPKQKGK